ncbi:MAG: HAD hydrolase-like protein [Clostridiales bacterium]|jgi:FMN phosphatase YigB (HAD superfamily)|nr:HAD hydrolase-like protein [Clostridiales bacterium]
MNKELIIFIDSGDTLIDESTEIKDSDGTVLHSQMIEGARETLVTLYESGYTIALVADGTKQSFDNIYNENGLDYCFKAKAISGELGKEKPAPIMFQHAMEQLGLTEKDKSRIVMIGNNLERDIVGANRMGITSILISYSPRYVMQPKCEEEIPDYVVSKPIELLGLLEQLNLQVKNRKILTNSDTPLYRKPSNKSTEV